MAGIDSYSALAGSLLDSGKVIAEALASGTTRNIDIDCTKDSTLSVRVDMNGAADADLNVSLQAFEDDNATIMPINIAPMNSIGPTFTGGKVYYYAIFDVTALQKVRLGIKNNNAGAQTINRAAWRLAG